jgi:AbrB family looped-hinge helix DNA binding protein
MTTKRFARRSPVRREVRVGPLLSALRTTQPATVAELFEVLRSSHPGQFRTKRDVYNALHHYAGDWPDSSPEKLFEPVSAHRWKLTEEGKRRAGEGHGAGPPPTRDSGPDESRLYERGQTVVPKKIRDAMGIEEGSTLVWQVEDGRARVFALPKDPVRALRGILKGKGPTFDEYLAERNAERQRERELEERQWGTS